MKLAALGLAVAALTVLGAHHLYLYIAAGAIWVAAVRLQPEGNRWIVIAFAIAMRLPGWLGAPAHSDDLHRYLWDGRVQRAGINPYLYTPNAPEVESLRDDNWSQVNNPQLPTIYPPLAQLLFRIAPNAAVWKILVAAADLGLVLLLMMRWPERATVWAWCPLAAIELGLDAHVDAIAILLMMAALIVRRKSWAGALLGASAAVKLLGIALLPGLRSRRAIFASVAVIAIVILPFLSAGPRLGGSLGEYGRRWRGNDGAFALIYAASETIVAHSDYRGRVEKKDSQWLRFMTGRDRDTIFPDEVASFAARAVAALLVLLAAGFAFWKKFPPLRFAEVVLGAFILLTPTLHPWYVLWVVPFVAAGGSPAWLVLAALAPLGYLPRSLVNEVWQDPIWTRLLEHGLTWSVLLLGLIPAKRPLLSSD